MLGAPWCLTPSGPQSFQCTQCPRCGASRSDALGASTPSGPQSLSARSALGASASLVPRCPRVKRPQCSSPLGAPTPSGPRSLGAQCPRCFGTPLFRRSSVLCHPRRLRASVHLVPSCHAVLRPESLVALSDLSVSKLRCPCCLDALLIVTPTELRPLGALTPLGETLKTGTGHL